MSTNAIPSLPTAQRLATQVLLDAVCALPGGFSILLSSMSPVTGQAAIAIADSCCFNRETLAQAVAAHTHIFGTPPTQIALSKEALRDLCIQFVVAIEAKDVDRVALGKILGLNVGALDAPITLVG